MREAVKIPRERLVASIFSQAKPILSEPLSSMRNSLQVVDSLIVKGHPNASINLDLKGRGLEQGEYDVFDALSKENTLVEVSRSNGDPIRVMDKLYPHGLMELMLMQSARKQKASICDLHYPTQGFCFELMSTFSEYANINGLYPYIAFSYDPKTMDRESGQGVKRWHAHLIGRTEEEKIFVQENRKDLEGLDVMRARRLVDETSILGSNVLYDLLSEDNLQTLEMRKPFTSSPYPLPFISFVLNNGWSTLRSNDFLLDFNRIHQSILSSYREVVGYLSIGKSEQWQRPLPVDLDTALIRIEGIPYLTAETKLQLMFALSNMKASVLKRNSLVNIENRDLTTHVMPMAGPCYSTSICEVSGGVIMGIRPYIFSDLGGAGVGMPYGIVTKIKKGGGVLNEDEMSKRRDFQYGFVKFAKLDN